MIPPLLPGRRSESAAEGVRGEREHRRAIARPPEQNEVGLSQILAVLRRNMKVVLLAMIMPSIAGLVFALEEEPAFRATAVVRLADARRALTEDAENDMLERELLRIASPILSQIQILQSRTVLGAAVDSTGLRIIFPPSGFRREQVADVWLDKDALPDTLSLRFTKDVVMVKGHAGAVRATYGTPLMLGGVRFTVTERPKVSSSSLIVLRREEAIDSLAANLRITPRPQTDVVEVDFTDPDSLLAATVTNTVVDIFQVANARAAQWKSMQRRALLERQIHDNDSLLLASQQQLSAFRSKVLFRMRTKYNGDQSDMRDLDNQRETLDTDRRMYGQLLEQMQTSTSGEEWRNGVRTFMASPTIAANPVIAQMYKQLTDYETAYDSLTTGVWRRAPSNPDVQRLSHMITETRQQLTGAVRSHLAMLDAQLASLNEQRMHDADSLRQLPWLEQEDLRLSDHVATLDKIGDQLRASLQKARLAAAVATGEVEVIDHASVPYKPLMSLKAIKLAFGIVLGFLLGAGSAYAREMRNAPVRRREELDELLPMPSLGVIPKAVVKDGHAWLRLVSLGMLGPANGHANGNGRRGRFVHAGENGNGKRSFRRTAERLVTLDGTPSPGSEAYRMLQTNLAFSPLTGTRRIFVVASAMQGEGKTLTAANVAVSFAVDGMRVLLIDGDMRHARQHRLFELQRAPGLTDILAGRVTTAEAIQATGVEQLFVLPSGTREPRPGEVVKSARMQGLLDEVAKSFDVVIIDTPPVMAVADALILGALADGVLFVVRAGITSRELLRDAVQQLETVGAHVIGTVLNDPAGEATTYVGQYYATVAQA